MKRSNLNENTLPPNPYIDTSIKCALIGTNKTFLKILFFSKFPLSQGLSEPAPMTPPNLFWMEGNSSIDFGLANHLQQFHFGRVFKKTSFFLKPFFFQTHFTNLPTPFQDLQSLFPFLHFWWPNILMSSVFRNNAHNSISSVIACSNVNTIVPCHKFHGSRFNNNNHAKFAFHKFVWNKHECHSSTYTL